MRQSELASEAGPGLSPPAPARERTDGVAIIQLVLLGTLLAIAAFAALLARAARSDGRRR